MMGGMDGARRLLQGETLKPKSTGATLKRFWGYLRERWYAIVLVVVLMFVNTWSQVTVPEIIGQSIDCYLFPRAGACWFAQVPADQPLEAKVAGLGTMVLV